ncbi:unnamed protein product [Soboliphyme baturini]|uniref:PX domain-containing protein n=1 Tax=Soboliphyme baturini TaxID=241478 RepID=A0A183IXX0_9BILA|nr:unnamed protein product [Soboliphyme baturini]
MIVYRNLTGRIVDFDFNVSRYFTKGSSKIDRFNRFVKSGTENYIVNACKITQAISQNIEIIVEWKPNPFPYTCQITSPQKASKLKGLKSFMTYQLTPSFSGIQVSRRYKHFDWLHEQMSGKYSAMLIPPLPEKQVSGRYEEEFIEHRMHLLQLWVSKICGHPVLSQCEAWMHFLSCTDDKKWKQGKRKVEKDEYKGGNLFYAITSPGQLLDAGDAENRVDKFLRMARSLDACCHISVQMNFRTYRRECRKLASAFRSLGQSLDLDPEAQLERLSEALRFTAEIYDNIGQMYEAQPKKDLEPLMDEFFIYRGMISMVPEAVQPHKPPIPLTLRVGSTVVEVLIYQQ